MYPLLVHPQRVSFVLDISSILRYFLFFYQEAATCFNKTPLLVFPRPSWDIFWALFHQTPAGYRADWHSCWISTIKKPEILSRLSISEVGSLKTPSHNCQCASSLLLLIILLWMFTTLKHTVHRLLQLLLSPAPRSRITDTSVHLLTSSFLDTFLRLKDHKSDTVELEDNSLGSFKFTASSTLKKIFRTLPLNENLVFLSMTHFFFLAAAAASAFLAAASSFSFCDSRRP